MLSNYTSVLMITKDPLQDYTQKAIKHLQASTIDYELILINRNKNWTTGSVINQALAAALGDRILILCDDCFVEPDTLEKLRDALRMKDVGIAGPSLLWPDGQSQQAGLSMVYAIINTPGKKQRIAIRSVVSNHDFTPLNMGFISGACMMFRRSVLDDIGGYDPTCVLGGGDLDFCWRAQDAGYTITLVEDTNAVHQSGTTRLKRLDNDGLEVDAMEWLLRKWQKTRYIDTVQDEDTVKYTISTGILSDDTRIILDDLLSQEVPGERHQEVNDQEVNNKVWV